MPGTSGILCPFGKIDGFMFNNDPEPDTFIPEFLSDLKEKMEKGGYEFVGINFGDDIDSYYDILMHAKDLEKDHFQVHMTSRNQPEIIITHENVELTNAGESSTDDEKTD